VRTPSRATTYSRVEESGAYTASNFSVKKIFKVFLVTVAAKTNQKTGRPQQQSGAYNRSIFSVKLLFLKSFSTN